MTINLYDVLGIDADATTEQVRAAWKDAIADLGPGDRMFRVYNQAAEVLLDPARRAEHDAEVLGADEPDGAPVAQPVVPPEAAPEPDPEPDPEPEPEPDPEPDPEPQPAPAGAVAGRPGPATWVLAVVGALAVAVVAVTVLTWVRLGGGGAGDGTGIDDERVRAAQSAAEQAAVPVLSYDFRDLDGNLVEAQSYMTDEYAAERSELVNDLRPTIEQTQTVVDAEVLSSAISQVTENRVDVLTMVDQRTTQAGGEPTVFAMWSTLSMTQVDGEWRVAGVTTTGVPAP